MAWVTTLYPGEEIGAPPRPVVIKRQIGSMFGETPPLPAIRK